jgi:hypothetical protein
MPLRPAFRAGAVPPPATAERNREMLAVLQG